MLRLGTTWHDSCVHTCLRLCAGQEVPRGLRRRDAGLAALLHAQRMQQRARVLGAQAERVGARVWCSHRQPHARAQPLKPRRSRRACAIAQGARCLDWALPCSHSEQAPRRAHPPTREAAQPAAARLRRERPRRWRPAARPPAARQPALPAARPGTQALQRRAVGVLRT